MSPTDIFELTITGLRLQGAQLGLFDREPVDTELIRTSQGMLDVCKKKQYPPPFAVLPVVYDVDPVAEIPFLIKRGETIIDISTAEGVVFPTPQDAWAAAMAARPVLEVNPDIVPVELRYRVWDFWSPEGGYYAGINRNQAIIYIPRAQIDPAWAADPAIQFVLSVQTPIVSEQYSVLRLFVNGQRYLIDGAEHESIIDYEGWEENNFELSAEVYPKTLTYDEYRTLLDRPEEFTGGKQVDVGSWSDIVLLVQRRATSGYVRLTREQVERALYVGLVDPVANVFLGPPVSLASWK